jgi:hypothetical protein
MALGSAMQAAAFFSRHSSQWVISSMAMDVIMREMGQGKGGLILGTIESTSCNRPEFARYEATRAEVRQRNYV